MSSVRRERLHRLAIVVAATVQLAACHGDSTTAPAPVPVVVGKPGLKVLLGATVTDTIGAQPAQALVVEVRGRDSLPARGTVVRFEAQRTTDTTRRGYAAIHTCSVAEPLCGQYPGADWQVVAVDTVDAQGRARALVHFGTIAGRAVVKVVVPDLAYVDSATYTVLPGAAASVRLGAASAILNIGATASLRGSVVDRWKNARSEVPTLTAGVGAALTIDATTGTATGRAMGLQTVTGTFGTFTDSTVVTVVPQGRLLVWSGPTHTLRLMNVDGTAVRSVLTNVGSDLGTFAAFDATRQQVTLHRGTGGSDGPSRFVVSVDTTGATKREINLGSLGDIYAQRRLADGTIRVVTSINIDLFSPTFGTLSSIAPDNTITTVDTLPRMLSIYGSIDISPDGTKVAYLIAGASGAELHVRTLSTGNDATLAPSARAPRWSARGDQMAFLDPTVNNGSGLNGVLNVINIDGTGRRALGTSVFYPGIAWSPDAAYIIGRIDFGTLQLTRVSDGASVLLFAGTYVNGSSDDLLQPDWR